MLICLMNTCRAERSHPPFGFMRWLLHVVYKLPFSVTLIKGLPIFCAAKQNHCAICESKPKTSRSHHSVTTLQCCFKDVVIYLMIHMYTDVESTLVILIVVVQVGQQGRSLALLGQPIKCLGALTLQIVSPVMRLV